MISPISTSCGCSIAKAIARATASGGKAEFVHRWNGFRARAAGSAIESPSSVRTKPGEIDVVRMTPSVDSWRRDSITVRTAFLVPAYTPISGTIFRPAVDTVVTKCPRPCLRNTGIAAAMPFKNTAQVHVDHRRPAVHIAVGQRSERADAGVAHQDVESAEPVDGSPHQPVEVFAMGDVDLKRNHVGTVHAKVVGDPLQPRDAARAEDKGRPTGGQQSRDGLPYAAAGAGDGDDGVGCDIGHDRYDRDLRATIPRSQPGPQRDVLLELGQHVCGQSRPDVGDGGQVVVGVGGIAEPELDLTLEGRSGRPCGQRIRYRQA